MFDPSDILYSRRRFLSRGAQLLSVAGTLPLFLDRSASCMAADYAANPAGAGRPDHRILVVLQLAGGNDGLNTVVPLGNDDYYNARPRLAIPKASAIRLTDDWGLHPSTTGFKQLYDTGNLAIINAVGYPNANRSHFRATDIWTTAEPERLGTTGWLGRYCDAACQGQDPGPNGASERIDPATAIALDVEPPPALVGAKYAPLAFQPPGASGGPGARRLGGGGMAGGDPFTKLNADDPSTPNSQMTDTPHVPETPASRAEQFLQRTSLNARLYAEKIRRVSNTIQNKAAYPQTPLARDLKLVAQLIASNMPTRIYYVKLGGFDTHANQAQAHPALLQQLAGGVASFIDDLQQLGQLDRVLVMTFSEFGRRVHENGSGTDHGEAAPMFLAGGRVKPGFHGSFPSLAADKLNRGDVPFTTDFRRVYATILNQWLGTDSTKVLGGRFDNLDLLA